MGRAEWLHIEAQLEMKKEKRWEKEKGRRENEEEKTTDATTSI